MSLDSELSDIPEGEKHLPLPLASFVGRKQEIVTARAILLREEVRLLTLTGPGGVGKTCLARHLATTVAHEFNDGVTYVSLASLQDANLVLASIAQSLKLQTGGRQSLLEQVQTWMQHRHLLLVLDNFEHVIAAAPSLVELLTTCPRLKVLVTSREILHIRGEHEFTISPLSLPDEQQVLDVETATRFEAVALFIERAQAVCPAFQLTSENVSLIGKICRRLDGLPLAIELAAARLKLLSLQALSERLAHRLQVLTGGPRDLPARQHTLRHTLQWSYDLLSQEEQRLFRLLTVFTGGCTLQAVEAVYNLLGGQSSWVLDGITSLLNKHLLYRNGPEHGESRLLMLETIREYGWECLCEQGEEGQTRSAHASYYLHLAEEAELHMQEEQQTSWFERLAQEQGNLQTALRWAMAHAEEEHHLEILLRLAAAARWWLINTELSWLEQALTRSQEVAISVRVNALQAAGCIAFLQDRAALSETSFKACLRLCRQANEQHGRVAALTWLGWLTWTMKGQYRAACTLLERCQTWARDQADAEILIWATFGLGNIALDQGDYPEAHALLEESLTLARAAGYKKYQLWLLRFLGRVLFALDDQAGASALVKESIALARELHDHLCLAGSLVLSGCMACASGDTSVARSLIEEGLVLFQKLGRERNCAYSYAHLAYVARQQGEMENAWTCYQESLTLFQQVGDVQGQAYCLRAWGVLIALQGEPVWAVRLWGAAEACSRLKGVSSFSLPVERLTYEDRDYEDTRSALRARLGDEAFTRTWAEGHAMTPEQVLAAQGYPLLTSQSSLPSKPEARPNIARGRTSSASHGLTGREMEVLRLVAQGLADAQVAEKLMISPRTVHAHLRSIYSKLDLPSRYAAIHYVLTHDLL